jgi:hypothetical protein
LNNYFIRPFDLTSKGRWRFRWIYGGFSGLDFSAGIARRKNRAKTEEGFSIIPAPVLKINGPTSRGVVARISRAAWEDPQPRAATPAASMTFKDSSV